ncbi:cell wall protein [Solicola gregarius]|uniref:Cell wall protein n=1 Tax=Solicola gregarius TaxID=2908642 RepID=A0AA46YKX8_9ACTN|nr:cell wall protein [Solicola gregarius]UYM05069.1 cell wall protein [Solicola gregarius]
MARRMDRRRLLSGAVLGGAGLVGATALGSLAPEAAGAGRSQKVDPGAPDPNFVDGRITGRDEHVLRVTSADGTLHRIRLTGGTSVWKLRPTTLDRIDVGDGLYARGVRMPAGELAADSIWVNIVNLTVHVTAIGKHQLRLDHRGSKVVGHVVAGTSAAVYNGTPAVSDLSMLRVGGHARVIGAWRPDTNEVDIATIYAAA